MFPAGFWRRAIAYSVDGLIVWLFAAIVVGIPVGLLYAATNGAIQFGPTSRSAPGTEAAAGLEVNLGGLSLIQCANVDLAELPEGLDPPPPPQPTFALDCRNFVFGFLETARGLTVGRVTKKGSTTTRLYRSYVLGADGKLRRAVSLNWLLPLLFFIYLVALQSRFGATLGMRLMHIRVVNVEAPGRVGVPLGRAVVRNLLLWAGSAPVWAVFLGFAVAYHGDLEAMFSGIFFTCLFAAALLAMAYYVWILVDLVRKRDPIYDRIARTAVLRSPS